MSPDYFIIRSAQCWTACYFWPNLRHSSTSVMLSMASCAAYKPYIIKTISVISYQWQLQFVFCLNIAWILFKYNLCSFRIQFVFYWNATCVLLIQLVFCLNTICVLFSDEFCLLSIFYIHFSWNFTHGHLEAMRATNFWGDGSPPDILNSSL